MPKEEIRHNRDGRVVTSCLAYINPTVCGADNGSGCRRQSEWRSHMRFADEKPAPVSELAATLRRDRKAVRRDAILLESFGLVSAREEML